MKKSTVRVFAIVLAALMCLSLLPLAAHAEEFALPEEVPVVPGFTWVGDHYVETEHIYGEIVNPDFLVDESEPGDCVTPALYWKSCINVYPFSEEQTRCGATAEAAYHQALDNLVNELTSRKNSGEKKSDAEWAAIAEQAQEEIFNKYTFTYGGTGHQWEYHEHQEATCTNEGWDTYNICTVCGAVDVGEIPWIDAKGHQWGEPEVVTEATCSEPGLVKYVCTICGVEETEEVPATGEHIWDDGVVAIEPTCAAAGQKVYTCTVCGATETEEIPATGEHVWDDGVVVLEPTCAAAGQKVYTCTVCGATETEEIPATGEHNFVDGFCTDCGAEDPDYVAPVQEPVTFETPAEPEKVETPAEPEKVETPAEPEKVEAPAEPEKVETPAEPEKVETPAEPEKVETPAEPEKVETPAEPEKVETPAEPEVYSGEVITRETAADAAVVDSFVDAMAEKGMTEENTNGFEVRNVTPYKEDGTELTDEEVAAMGGVTFVMDVPEGFDPDKEALEIYHYNKDTDTWELMDTFVQDGKVYVRKASAFSPFGLVSKKLDDQIGIRRVPLLGATADITVTYDGNGGKTSDNKDTVTETTADSSVFQAANLFTRDGYEFAGWCVEQQATTEKVYNPGETIPFSTDRTVYAQWKKILSITYYGNGGDGDTPPASSTAGDPYKISVNGYTKGDADFTGWNTKSDGSGKAYEAEKEYTLTDNLTLYAQWAYEVSFDGNGATSGTMAAVNAPEKKAFTIPANEFTFDGHSFVGWATSDTATTKEYDDKGTILAADMTGDLTLYALWADTFTVAYDANGSSDTPPQSETKTAGEKINLPANNLTPPTGYKANGWKNADTTDTNVYADGAEFTVNGNVTFNANWEKLIPITFNPNGSTDTAPTSPAYAEANKDLTIPDNTLTRDGFTAHGWNTQESGEGGTHYDTSIPAADLTADKADTGITLYAEWQKKASVTMTIVGSGKIQFNGVDYKDQDVGYLNDGVTEVEVTLTADSGYAIKEVNFNGSAAAFENGVCKVKPNANQDNQLKVTFAQITTTPVQNVPDTKVNDLKALATSGGYDADQVYVADITPAWASGSALTADEKKANGTISFWLNYPGNVDLNNLSDYDIQVLHHDGTSWKPVDQSNVTKQSDRITVTVNATDFSPYGVMAKNKYVTLKFYASGTGTSLASYLPNDDGKKVEDGNTYSMPDAASYAKEQGKAFSGWSENQDGSGNLLSRGTEITIDSSKGTTRNYYAVLEDGAAITFEANNGSGETKTIIVPRGQAQDLPECPFTYAGHVFDKWQETVSGTKYTYADRASFTTSSDRTLVAQWKTGEAPAAPDNLSASKSILNPGKTDLEDQKGEISGTQTSMEVYQGGGKWKQITAVPYKVDKPGTYEIRFKANAPELASESVTVDVHSYYTESSDPTDIGTDSATGKKAFKYTVNLMETSSSGSTSKVSQTALHESVMFGLKYPTGYNATNYKYELYHLPERTKIDCDPKTSGIIGSYTDFSEFLLLVEDKVTVTFNPNGGTNSSTHPMTAQKVEKGVATPLDSIVYTTTTSSGTTTGYKITRSGYFFNGWNTQPDGKGTAYADGANITTSKDITLYAQWVGPLQIKIGNSAVTEASIGDTLTADIKDASGKEPTGVTYQWYRLASASSTTGTPISGATAKTYKVTADDMGSVLLCRATNANGQYVNSINRVEIDSIEWLRDIVNDANSSSYGVYAQSGAIDGLSDGMKYTLLRANGSVETGTVSGVKDGIWYTNKEGDYIFTTADGSAVGDPITVYDWYTVGYQVTTSSGTTGTSSGVRMLLDGGAMPTYLFTNATYRDRYDVLRYTNSAYSPLTSSYSTSYSSAYTLYAVKKGSNPTITLTVTPPAGTYAHVSLNGSSIASWGSGTTTTANGTTRTTTTYSRTFTVTPPNNGPKFYTIIFNNSATSPRTADESNLGLWSALCLTSVVGAATILTESRKRRKNRG